MISRLVSMANGGFRARPTVYLTTPAGKETQRKLWDETMAEMVKVDTRLIGCLDY